MMDKDRINKTETTSIFFDIFDICIV
jgi:hypothetical protein